jgi:adenylosuccinate lyase
MLNRFTGLIDQLIVYPERMLTNLQMTKGVIFSQMVLLKLIEKGISREAAYAIVQRNAMRSWQEGLDFQELLLQDDEVMARLNTDDLSGVFQIENFLKQIDFIFNRVFGEKT